MDPALIVIWVYGLWCMPAWLMCMWLPADDVIYILFLFAVDAIQALKTYIGTLPTEYKYFSHELQQVYQLTNNNLYIYW